MQPRLKLIGIDGKQSSEPNTNLNPETTIQYAITVLYREKNLSQETCNYKQTADSNHTQVKLDLHGDCLHLEHGV